MGPDGAARLIDFFAGHGIERFFVWLSPGSRHGRVRSLLDQAGLSRVHWTRYPTLCRERPAPVPFKTDLRIRQVGPDDIAGSREALGETLWPELRRRQAGTDFSTTWRSTAAARSRSRRSACSEDIGYLMAAATVESDRQRGAQQALIAKRVEQAERLGCAVLVSETLSMLETPIAICGAPDSRRSIDKEVYEWNA